MTLETQLNTAIRASIRQMETESLRQLRHAASPFSCLTLQEKHILLLVAEGETNSMIAAKMPLSSGTVKNYVSSILAKLQTPNRAGAASYATQHNLESHLKGK